MDACDKSVTEVDTTFGRFGKHFNLTSFEVFADKIYPLREFRTIKENFLVGVRDSI